MPAVDGRYARAFAEVMMANGAEPGTTVEDLEQMAALVGENAALRHVFENPSVEHKQKLGLLDAIMERTGGVASRPRALLRNFIAVLIDRKRIGQLEEIAALFKQELDQRMGIAEARVTSFRTLGDTEKKSLETQLAAVTGKTIRASYSEDPGLLGGAVVRVGSTIYDGSIRGQLERIRQRLAGI